MQMRTIQQVFLYSSPLQVATFLCSVIITQLSQVGWAPDISNCSRLGRITKIFINHHLKTMFTLSDANRNCLQLEINDWDATLSHRVLVEYHCLQYCRITVLHSTHYRSICYQHEWSGLMAAPDPWSGNFSHPMALLLHPLPNRQLQWSGVEWSGPWSTQVVTSRRKDVLSAIQPLITSDNEYWLQ